MVYEAKSDYFLNTSYFWIGYKKQEIDIVLFFELIFDILYFFN